MLIMWVHACRPDVLLVERSVARAAQEELLNRGISLVHHTKPELLERLARCMGVKVRHGLPSCQHCLPLQRRWRQVELVATQQQCMYNRISTAQNLLLGAATPVLYMPSLLYVKAAVGPGVWTVGAPISIACCQDSHHLADASLLLPSLHHCMQVAGSVEELSSVFVGSCSRFRVELMPQAADSAAGAGAAEASSTAAASNAMEPSAAAGASVGAAVQPAGSGLPVPAAPRAGSARPTPVSATPAPPKTLMVFDGCPLPLGCTVLLQGASAAELTKVKRVVKFGVLAAYHLCLEVNFLAEELALATAALASPGEAQDASAQNVRCRAAGVLGSALFATVLILLAATAGQLCPVLALRACLG